MARRSAGQQPTLADLITSLTRTLVPLIVGLIVSLALRAGYDLHGYTPEITAAVTYLYYLLARILEHYADSRFGWLLGVAAHPSYRKASRQ